MKLHDVFMRRMDKSTLQLALEKANTAVSLDRIGDSAEALENYVAACRLLNIVIFTAKAEEDKLKLQKIVSS
jgi:uncharacterized protein GlcG (DUF336 family)